MEGIRLDDGPVFRLWISTCHDWQPTRWSDVPPRATAVEAIDDRVYETREAALTLAGFNQKIIEDEGSLWLVAVPVTLRCEGDARPGSPIAGYQFPPDEPL